MGREKSKQRCYGQNLGGIWKLFEKLSMKEVRENWFLFVYGILEDNM